MKWTFNKTKLPTKDNKLTPIGNLSLIEHPHGGLVAIICYRNPNSNSLTLSSYYFDESTRGWSPQGESLHFILSKETPTKFSQVTFLNLMGNLQMMYQSANKLLQNISYDYGKTWKTSDGILEDEIFWTLNNSPVFVGMGRVLLPVYDEDSGRSFAYVSDDTGKRWFPSVYIEPPEDMSESYHPDDFFSCKMQSPTFIQAGERKILCYMQSEPNQTLMKAISDDFGETWSTAEPIEIPYGEGGIDTLRLRDSNGDFIPTVVIAYSQKKEDGKYSINLALSSDIGETWDEKLEIDELDAPFSDICILQTIDTRVHVLYSSIQGVYHLVANDFVRL